MKQLKDLDNSFIAQKVFELLSNASRQQQLMRVVKQEFQSEQTIL